MKTKKINNKQQTTNDEIPVVDIYSLDGKKVDKFKLNPDIFNIKISKALLHQVVLMYQANKRQGTAATKKRGEVSGGGKKPWKQKGTGRARIGSIRSPLWKGGGTIFGPEPRDFSYSLPKKLKRKAVITALSLKTRDNELIVLEKDIELNAPKTKSVYKVLSSLKVDRKKVLMIVSKNDKNILCSSRNIKGFVLKNVKEFNALDLLLNSRIIFSKDTYKAIVNRFKVGDKG